MPFPFLSPRALSRLAVAFASISLTVSYTPLCKSNEARQGRFPTFAPTWDMQSSTIVQPCNMSGFLEPVSFYAQFGVSSNLAC